MMKLVTMFLVWSLSVEKKSRKFISAFLLSIIWCSPSWSAPYSASELFANETSREKDLRGIRDQEIRQIQLTLKRKTEVRYQAELYFRLAEIYLEHYRSAFILEGRAFEKRLARNLKDKKIDRSYSKPFMKKGISACEKILSLKIPFNKIDRVHYFLAFYAQESGNQKKAKYHFSQIISKYPKSVFVAEAYRSLGEMEFNKNRYRAAQVYYEKSIQMGNAETRPGSYHKLAWSYYRQKRYRDAINMMKKAISEAQKSKEKYLSLKEEGMRDMAIFMVEGGSVKEAVVYFEKVSGDPKALSKTLESLGAQFERTGRKKKAVAVYQAIIDAKPTPEAVFRARTRMIDLKIQKSQYTSAAKDIQKLKGSSEFADGFTKTAYLNVKAQTRRVATESHEAFREVRKKKGSKSKARLLLQRAELYYQTYLNVFLKDRDPRSESNEIKMYLADVKRLQGKVDDASSLYKDVLEAGDDRYSKEAGNLWVTSLDQSVQRYALQKSKKKKKLKGKTPSAIESEFVKASDTLNKNTPGSKEALEAGLKSAQILAGYSDTRKAGLNRARTIAKRYPQSSQGLIAAQLWGQILREDVPVLNQNNADQFEERVENLQEGLNEIGSIDELIQNDRKNNKSKLMAWLKDTEKELKIGSIELNEKRKDYHKAAKGYEVYAAENKGKEAEKGYQNALYNYNLAGEVSESERVIRQWMNRFPKSNKAKSAFRSLATEYLINGNFDQSADLFHQISVQQRDPSAQRTSYRIYEGLGKKADEMKQLELYLAAYKTRSDRAFVHRRLAALYEEQGNDENAKYHYEQCRKIKLSVRVECLARLGDLYLRLSNEKAAKINYQRAADVRKTGSPFVGYARYQLALLKEKTGVFSPLTLPEKKLQQGLSKRLQFFNPLSKAYGKAVEAGGPWGMAALHRLALWTLNFANEVDKISPPKGATAAQIQTMRKTLSAVSKPLRQQALSTLKQAFEQANRKEILSGVNLEVADQLADRRYRGGLRAQGPFIEMRLTGPRENRESLSQVRTELRKKPRDSFLWIRYGNALLLQGQPKLAILAYDQALGIEKKNARALNNKAVALHSYSKRWDYLLESQSLLKMAYRTNSRNEDVHFNLGTLYNEYRLFKPSLNFWKKAVKETQDRDHYLGFAVALQGNGKLGPAIVYFKKAVKEGLDEDSFGYGFHYAVRESLKGKEGAQKCESITSDIETKNLLEKESVKRLEMSCHRWRK